MVRDFLNLGILRILGSIKYQTSKGYTGGIIPSKYVRYIHNISSEWCMGVFRAIHFEGYYLEIFTPFPLR